MQEPPIRIGVVQPQNSIAATRITASSRSSLALFFRRNEFNWNRWVVLWRSKNAESLLSGECMLVIIPLSVHSTVGDCLCQPSMLYQVCKIESSNSWSIFPARHSVRRWSSSAHSVHKVLVMWTGLAMIVGIVCLDDLCLSSAVASASKHYLIVVCSQENSLCW